MIERRRNVNFVYFVVVGATLLLRISTSLGAGQNLAVSSSRFFTLVVQLLIFGALPAVLYFVFCKKGDFHQIGSLFGDFGFKKCGIKNLVLCVLLGFLMIFAATFISWAWSSVLNAMGYTRVPSSTDYSDVSTLFAELFFVAVLPGVFEEFTHRGLLMAGYKNSMSDGWKAVAMSALMFALMHQNITQTGYTFFDGIVLALVAYYTGSIYPAMLIHVINNAVSVIEDYCVFVGSPLTEFTNGIYNWFLSSVAGYFVYVIAVAAVLAAMVLIVLALRKDAKKNGRLINDGKLSGGEYPSAHRINGELVTVEKPRFADDVLMYITIIVGVVATIFSLVWGILR